MDTLCFVQFLHPGVEHVPDKPGRISWNTLDQTHKRKFIKAGGRYLHRNDMRSADLMFWGEWEPESEVVEEIWRPLPDGPRYLYRPYYVKPASYEGLQNTDPFVFGGRFYYSVCHQLTNHGASPTTLRNLDRGSVILFGSRKSGSFVLDTVFVVKDWAEHSAHNLNELMNARVPRAYLDTVTAPIYGGASIGCAPSRGQCRVEAGNFCRLYIGATYDDPVDGMFSFFPCLPYEPDSIGFERPAIRLSGIINDSHKQNFKATPRDRTEIRELWNRTVGQVEKAGLYLGLSAQMPECLPGP